MTFKLKNACYFSCCQPELVGGIEEKSNLNVKTSSKKTWRKI